MADRLERRTKSLKERGIRIAERTSGFVLDLVFPVPPKTLRQRDALIRYRNTPRFRDPIHGFHTERTRTPSARVLQITKWLNRAEMTIQYAVEEVPIHIAKRGINSFTSQSLRIATFLDRAYRRSIQLLKASE